VEVLLVPDCGSSKFQFQAMMLAALAVEPSVKLV
jgi:hypothetical protein